MNASRINTLRKLLVKNRIDALLVLIEENRLYLSGFSGEDHQCDESAGALLITQKRLILATDSRFAVQAGNEAPLFNVVIYRKGLAKMLPDLAKRHNICKLGFESVRVTVRQINEYKKELSAAAVKIELIPLEDLVEGMRLIKSEEEIEKTRQALSLAESVYRNVVCGLRPGMTEKEVAWSMERGMREAGADALAFPVIVAAGTNSALPHAIPTDRPIAVGEPILFDWGARLNSYCSDTSRTVILGTPDAIFLKVYQTVLEAQQKALAAIKSGVSSKTVDSVARQYIRRRGYKGKFGHGLGHGTGLAVHEGPRLSPIKESVLQAGMILTVEPGVYLPQWGGVRIEHQVVVQEEGAMVLNQLSTSFDINAI